MELILKLPEEASLKVENDIIRINFEDNGVNKLYQRVETILVKDNEILDNKDLVVYDKKKIEINKE
mgnify:FL=1